MAYSESIRKQLMENTASVMREVVTLKNEKEELQKFHEKEMDEVFCEFITVIDTFERSEQAIKEKELDKEDDASKCVKRLLNAKKKALAVLEKYDVKQIVFENNQAQDELCTVVDTEPDASRNTGDIVSVEKIGYTRKGRLIRPAEVIIVKN